MRNNKIYAVLIITALLSFSCSIDLDGLLNSGKIGAGETSFPSGHECIASFQTFAYGAFEWQETVDLDKTPPLPPWQIETSLPPMPEMDITPRSLVLGTQETGTDNQIWLSREYRNDEGIKQKQFLVYSTNLGNWRSFSAEMVGYKGNVDYVFLAANGTVWGLTYETLGRNEENPIVSSFNPNTERFEFIDSLPPLYLFRGRIVFDSQQNLLWLFIPNDAIYSYDFANQQLLKEIEISEIDVAIARMNKDKTFLVEQVSLAPGLHNFQLFQVFPETNEIQSIPVPEEPFPGGGGLLLDSTGKLWIGAMGWKDEGGYWHLLHPDPEGYFENLDDLSLSLASPSFNCESSNGYLWYRRSWLSGANGFAWYDPATGEGCWFTSEFGNLVEDSQQRLWLEADGKLYKYVLFP